MEKQRKYKVIADEGETQETARKDLKEIKGQWSNYSLAHTKFLAEYGLKRFSLKQARETLMCTQGLKLPRGTTTEEVLEKMMNWNLLELA